MTAKEWLGRAWEIDKEIRALKREALAAKDLALSITARLDGEKVQTSKENYAENAMVRYLDYSDRIARRTEELFAVKIEAYEMILQVDSRELRTLLSLRYLSYLTWEQIAEEMEVDVRHVYRLHKAADIPRTAEWSLLELAKNRVPATLPKGKKRCGKEEEPAQLRCSARKGWGPCKAPGGKQALLGRGAAAKRADIPRTAEWSLVELAATPSLFVMPGL